MKGKNAKMKALEASMGPPCEHGGRQLANRLGAGLFWRFNGAAV